MTYKELLAQLQTLSDEQLNATVTVFDPYNDDYIAVVDTGTATDADAVNNALDPDHFYMVLKA